MFYIDLITLKTSLWWLQLPNPLERRLTLSITDNLVRLSVGIESVDDLIAGLEQALTK